jgi:hypothetical protein
MRPVQVGVSTGQERVIATGVQLGERIVVDGLQKVSDGALVVPEEARAAVAPAQQAVSQGSKN